MTAPAWTALPETRPDSHGLASSHQRRLGLAAAPQVTVASASGHALGRDKRRATPKRPRPAHAKTVPPPCPRSRRPGLPSSPRRATSPPQATRARCWPTRNPVGVSSPSSGGGLPPVAFSLSPPCRTRATMSLSLGPATPRRATAAFAHSQTATAGRSQEGGTASPPFRRHCICGCALRGLGTQPKPCGGRRTWGPWFCLPRAQNSTPGHGLGGTAQTSWPPSRPRRSRPDQRPCAS